MFVDFSTVSVYSLMRTYLSRTAGVAARASVVVVLLTQGRVVCMIFFPPVSTEAVLVTTGGTSGLSFLCLGVMFCVGFAFVFCSVGGN